MVNVMHALPKSACCESLFLSNNIIPCTNLKFSFTYPMVFEPYYLFYSKWSTDVRRKNKFTALLAVPQAHLPQDDLRLPKLYKQYFTNLTIV